MENDPFEQESQLEMKAQLTDTSRGFLLETAKWGKFLAIVGFVMTGLMVIGGLFFSTIFASIPGMTDNPAMPLGAGFMGAMYVIGGAFYFFPSWYLFRFATRTKDALLNYSTDTLTEGLENLKSVYKFWGIFTAIIVGIYGIILVFGLIAALFTAF